MRSRYKNDEEFNQFLDNKYFDEISELYGCIKEKKKKIIISKIRFGLIIEGFFIVITNVIELNKYVNGFLWLIDLVTILIISVIAYSSTCFEIRKIMKSLNDEIIKDIFSFISDNDRNEIEYSPEKKISKDSLNEAGLFNLDIVNYDGKNFTKVPYYKNTMIFSDLCTYVYDKSTQKKKKIFDGIYIGATMNKKNKNYIYLVPNNISDKVVKSKIKSYIHYKGYDINLENAEFTKKYKVFCDDEIQARYILSMSLMERINKVDEIFKSKKYIIFKEGKRFSMCIEGVSIDKIKQLTLPVIHNKEKEREVLLKIFNNLNNLFKIYHILDLENELYTKYNIDDYIEKNKIQEGYSISKAEAQKIATISFKNND